MSRRTKALRYYRSSKPVSPLKKFLLGALKFLVILFLLYHIVFFFLLQSYEFSTNSMNPSFFEGERVIATPLLFGATVPFTSYRLPAFRSPRRGDTVVVSAEGQQFSGFKKIADTAVRFFTLQKISLPDGERTHAVPNTQVKRIIGVSGDTVKMENFRVQIKTARNTVFLDEHEVVQKEYGLSIPSNTVSTRGDTQTDSRGAEQTDAPVDDPRGAAPFSGTLPPIRLEEGEFLAVPDNRAASAASGSWKSVTLKNIESLTLFKYSLPF